VSDVDLRAVIIGSLVDAVGTLVVSIAFEAAVFAATGATSAEDFVTIVEGSTSLQVAQLVLGLALTAVGGYVAAWVAKSNERLNAFAVGVVSTAIGFLYVFSAPESAPFWAEAAGLLLTIPAAFAGGEARVAVVRMMRR
jgi:hypothetical protein